MKIVSDQELDVRPVSRSAIVDALMEANPRKMLERKVRVVGERLEIGRKSFDLKDVEHIFVIGGGKASAYMAEQLEYMLNGRITQGVVNVPDYQKVPKLRRITLHAASHPLPSSKGEAGVRNMLELARGIQKQDLVLCVISGGGSALMPLPVEGVGLREIQQITEQLLGSGATIQEMNCVRKHLSAIGGGRLAEKFRPAAVVGLIISDVIGNDLASVASGPTVPDKTTFEDAKRVLSKFSLWRKASPTIREYLVKGNRGTIPETPKPESRVFRRVHNVLVGSNDEPCKAAVRRLAREGYNAKLLTTSLQGEAEKVGRDLGKLGKSLLKRSEQLRLRTAFVAGGETTVKIRGSGTGGRNQHLVLSAAIEIEGTAGITVLAFATDGIDGPTEAAGAYADWRTVGRARQLGMNAKDYLRRDDSYIFFKRLGDLLISGPTGTNVNDIMIVLVDRIQTTVG